MAYQCYRCNQVVVQEEFQRCPSCETAHQRLCEELDARPNNHIKPIREELFPIKEVKQGILVTTWISREDAKNMGIQLPQ